MSSNKNLDIAISVSIIERPSNYAFGDTMALLSPGERAVNLGICPLYTLTNLMGSILTFLCVGGVILTGRIFCWEESFQG